MCPDPFAVAFDCRACGACCMDASDGRVLVSAEDIVRWRRAGATHVLSTLVPGHFGAQAFAANADGRCVHLGTAQHETDCSIYETRGESCRAVEVGGDECLAYRRARGMDTRAQIGGVGCPP